MTNVVHLAVQIAPDGRVLAYVADHREDKVSDIAKTWVAGGSAFGVYVSDGPVKMVGVKYE